MDDKIIDDFLRAYKSETDQPPSRQAREAILAVPDLRDSRLFPNILFSLLQWFDQVMPRAVGWAFACFLGVYLGLGSPEQGIALGEEEDYMYDQAQLLISEEYVAEGTNVGDVD